MLWGGLDWVYRLVQEQITLPWGVWADVGKSKGERHGLFEAMCMADASRMVAREARA